MITLRASATDALQAALLLIVLGLLDEEQTFRRYPQRDLLTALPAWQPVAQLFGDVGAATMVPTPRSSPCPHP